MKRLLGLVITLVPFFVGCATEEIVVASRPTQDGGLPRDVTRCTEHSHCQSGDYCSLASCGAIAGECKPRPVLCPSDAVPVCGCDGVTYFNECLMRAAGASLDGPNPCHATALACGGDAPCPGDAHCARLAAEESECSVAVGRCWVVPAECPAATSADRWLSCEPLRDGGADGCVDTCHAVQRDVASFRTLRRCL